MAEQSIKKSNKTIAWLIVVGLLVLLCAIMYVVGGSGGKSAVPTPFMVTLVCADCAQAGIEINLWQTPARLRGAGSVPHNTRATVLETTTHEGRLFYRVSANAVIGWLPEDFVQR